MFELLQPFDVKCFKFFLGTLKAFCVLAGAVGMPRVAETDLSVLSKCTVSHRAAQPAERWEWLLIIKWSPFPWE